jgi:hypothetical protein
MLETSAGTTPGDTVNTVATTTGHKAHYAKPGSDTTLCGRETSNATSGNDMCKRCVATRAKLDAYSDRTAYNAGVADTQDGVLNEATPAERTGVDLTAEQIADKTIRQHKLSDTMIETLTYRYSPLPQAVNAQMWADARTEAALVKRGLMHPTDSHRTVLGHKVTQILMAPYDKPSQEIPGQMDISDVEPQDTPKIPAQRPKPDPETQTVTCHDCRTPAGTEHAWDCRYSRNVVPAVAPASGPERPGFVSVPIGVVTAQIERDMERDAYAKTIAKQYDRSWQMGILADDGSIPQPDRLIREILTAMADIVIKSTGDFINAAESVTLLTELGWLLAYVMESGTVDSDGWQDRRRPAVPGWEDQETYDLDPDTASALPAWADWERNDSGCSAVITAQSYDEQAEHCGTPVTREEYYKAGDEGTMCVMHRSAYERAGEEPW